MYDFSKVTERTKALAAVDEILASIRSIAQIKQGRTGQRFYLEQNDKECAFCFTVGSASLKNSRFSGVINNKSALYYRAAGCFSC